MKTPKSRRILSGTQNRCRLLVAGLLFFVVGHITEAMANGIAQNEVSTTTLAAPIASRRSDSQKVAMSFATNSLVIPMDTVYQDDGMLRAYGLVYQLLLSGIKVHWVILGGKAQDGVDVTLTATDIRSNVVISNAQYRGGPFVVAAVDSTAALSIITAWNAVAQLPVVTVHRANAGFTADVRRLMSAAPRIAVFADSGEIVAFNNLNAAGIRDSTGQAWPLVEDVTRAYAGYPDILNSNHPPAKPGAFNTVSRSKRLNGVAHAAPTFGITLR